MKPSSGKIGIAEAGKTGIVFQEPDNQLFMPTVWEDVVFGVMKEGESPEKAREKSLNALKSVDAEYIADRPPYKLSGGEKQRAALASILIMEPDILLLDEPTAALDPRARKNIIKLLQSFQSTRIIASHDLDMLFDIADEIVFLHNGSIAARSGVPGLLFDEAFLQSIGLELPLCACRR
jgi:cobalt/nickel transport system ATP-binding protein